MYFAAKRQRVADAARDEFIKYALSQGNEIESYGAECFKGNKVPAEIKKLSGQSILILQTGGYILSGRGYYEETEDEGRPIITIGKGDRVSIHIWPSTVETMYVAKAKVTQKKEI